MATWTKAELAARVLEYIGKKVPGQGAAAEDDLTAQEAIDSVYEQFRLQGLVPFEIATIPEWALQPLKKYVAGELATEFGISGQRLMEFKMGAREARKELRRQVQVQRTYLPTKVSNY